MRHTGTWGKVVVVLGMVAGGWGGAEETQRADPEGGLGPRLPAGVRQGLKTHYPDSTIVEVDTQQRDRMKPYEIKIVTADDHILDVLFSPEGDVVEVKEIVPKTTVTAPALKTLKQEGVGGEVKKVERMEVFAAIRNGMVIPLEKPKVYYEGEVAAEGGGFKEILVSAHDGAVVYDSSHPSAGPDATPALDELLKGRAGWLGFEAVPAEAELLKKAGRTAGVRVLKVHPGGPADKAQLAAGDLVWQVEGEPMGQPGQLQKLLERFGAGSRLKLKMWRAGTVLEKLVVVEIAPQSLPLKRVEGE